MQFMSGMNRAFALTLILVSLTVLCIITAKPAFASADSWTEKAPIPTERFELGVAVVNGRIYAIGGQLLHSFNTYSGINEEYDPKTNTWTTMASMPTPRANFGIAVYRNKIYCIGGSKSNGVTTGVNEVYDPSTNSWATKNPLPTPRYRLDASFANGRIFLVGGFESASIASTYAENVSSINEVYDPSSDAWTKESPLPFAVSDYASAVVDDKIYVIGNSNENLTQIYTPETDTWTYGAPVPTTSAGYYPGGAGVTTGVFAPKRIYVLGGEEAGLYGSSLGITLIYDPENDTWGSGAPMPTARSNLGVAVVNDVLYAIGGEVNWDGYTGANEQYTPAGYRAPDSTYQTPSPSSTPSPTPTLTPTPTPTQAQSPSPSTLTPSPSVPEFPTWIILPLTTIMTLIAAMIVRRRGQRKLSFL